MRPVLIAVVLIGLLALAGASHAFYFSTYGGSGYSSFSGYSYSNFGYSNSFYSPGFRTGYYSNPFGSYYGGYGGYSKGGFGGSDTFGQQVPQNFVEQADQVADDLLFNFVYSLVGAQNVLQPGMGTPRFALVKKLFFTQEATSTTRLDPCKLTDINVGSKSKTSSFKIFGKEVDVDWVQTGKDVACQVNREKQNKKMQATMSLALLDLASGQVIYMNQAGARGEIEAMVYDQKEILIWENFKLQYPNAYDLILDATQNALRSKITFRTEPPPLAK